MRVDASQLGVEAIELECENPYSTDYDTLVRYLNLQDCGRVLGGGCGTPGMTARSGYPERAYELGRAL